MLCPHPHARGHDDDRVIADDGAIAPGRAVVAGHFAVSDDHVVGAHHVSHSYAAIAYYTAGRARLSMQGAWQVEAGDVLIVPAGMPHRSTPKTGGDDLSFWGLAVCSPCLASDALPLLEVFERVRDGGAAVVRIADDRRDYLVTLFQELSIVRERADASVVDAVERSLLTLIMNEIGRASPSRPLETTAPAPHSKSVVIDALRFVERHCLRQVSLAEIAAAVGKSPSYVTSALTAATGKSAKAWILAGRMAEARRLLLHSDEFVDVIAERVGYADASHFIRLFRREHGVTPAAWRAARLDSGA